MKPLTLICALFITLFAHAQKKSDVPDFGQVEKADLEMKECDFDKKAEAVVLFETGELFANFAAITPGMMLEEHVRIKILSDKGLNQADIHLMYEHTNGRESIKNLEAQIYNLDASGNIVTTKVDRKLIFDKAIDKHFHEEVFTFPEVKAGSIIEYKYTKAWSGFSLVDWYFQRAIPVKYSRYKVDFPSEFEVDAIPMCVLPYDAKEKTTGARNIHIFSMKNIPALRDEPYISSDKDYSQRIEFRFKGINLPGADHLNLTENWAQVIGDLLDDRDFGVQLKKSIPLTPDLEEQLNKTSDPYRKMTIIHEYVRKNMAWNGYGSFWALNGVREAWNDKKGTAGEINMILVNLLKDAGLKAGAILASTRDHGTVAANLVDYRQFNKVLAGVTIGNRFYVLDATEKNTPANLIPENVMFTLGLMIDNPSTGEWEWKPLWDQHKLDKNLLILQADIDESGIMKGQASLSSYDYARLKRISDTKDKNKFIGKYFSADNPGAEVDSLELENLENDTLPLLQKFQFSKPLSASGDYKYFSVNMFTGLEKNQFVADNRFSDIFFGVNQSHSIIANINIPDEYQFEALPKNTRMIMPDTSIIITRQITTNGNQVGVRINLDFKKPYYSVQEYAAFKEFYKQLFALLNEQIAIKKKS